MKKTLFTLMVISIAATALAACKPSAPQIEVTGAWVRPDPLMENGAGYLLITNTGGSPDFLVGVSSDIAKMTSAHQSVMDGDVHKMIAVPNLEIPAGGQVEFKPMSYHVMLMGLSSDLEYGQFVTLTLTFEVSGEIKVQAEVRKE